MTFITLALCEKEGSVGVVGLETADASTDGVTGLDIGGESSNNCAMSNDFSEEDLDHLFVANSCLEIDE